MPPPNDAPTDEEKQASVVDAIIAHEEKRIPFSTGKKWGLLAMFSFAMFIDSEWRWKDADAHPQSSTLLHATFSPTPLVLTSAFALNSSLGLS
jgi:hypothetical protein